LYVESFSIELKRSDTNKLWKKKWTDEEYNCIKATYKENYKNWLNHNWKKTATLILEIILDSSVKKKIFSASHLVKENFIDKYKKDYREVIFLFYFMKLITVDTPLCYDIN
jgi:hypothetical protein